MTHFYFLLGSAGLCLVCFLSLFKSVSRFTNPLYHSEALYLFSISACLLLTKFCFFNASMMNVDESIMLSAGRVLGLDPRPWISVDPTTSGPLNYLPATLLLRLADTASYGELRMIYVLAFQIPTICIFFLTIRSLSDAWMARLLIIPLVLTLGLFYYHDLVHASSEHMPMLFMSGVFCTLVLISYDKVRRWQLVAAGVLCALSFYAKLQATPIFLCLAAFCFLLLYFGKNRPMDAVLFASCFVITNLAALSVIAVYGGLSDFVQSYVIGNFKYAGTIPMELPRALDFFKHSIAGLLPLLVTGAAMAFLIVPHFRRPHFSRADMLFLGGLLTILLVAAYCVAKPGRFFLHYSILLIIPLYTTVIWLAVRSGASLLHQPFLVHGLLICLLWGFNAQRASRVISGWSNPEIVNQAVVTRLEHARKPADRMAVWGWGTPYNHALRMLMGTRDVHFDFQVSYTGELGNYYRQRFLTDLKENHPEWFLDLSVASRPDLPAICSLGNFKEIQQFVTRYYSVVYRTNGEVLYRRKHIPEQQQVL